MVQLEDTLFAPLYWGFVAAVLLTGVTVVQAYVYFNNAKDGAVVRWTAVFMLVMDLVSSALIAQSIYYYLIPNFGSFEQFAALTKELDIDCLISAVITFISQLYFARQLNTVRKPGKPGQLIAIWVTIITAILGFAGGLGCVTMMFMYGKSVLSSENRSVVFSVFFSLAKGWAAIADITATAAMCVWLTNSRTGIKETNYLIRELVKYTMQRGVLVTAIQALVLITFWAAPSSLAWFALHMSVTKLYVNTFFAMLNGRAHLREQQSGKVISSIGPSHISQYGITSAQARTIDRTGDNDAPFALEKMGNYKRHSQDDSEYKPKVAMPTITTTVLVAEV